MIYKTGDYLPDPPGVASRLEGCVHMLPGGGTLYVNKNGAELVTVPIRPYFSCSTEQSDHNTAVIANLPKTYATLPLCLLFASLPLVIYLLPLSRSPKYPIPTSFRNVKQAAIGSLEQ